jgi:hypothetical protein
MENRFLTNVKILGFTPNGRHVWVEYLEGEKKGLRCKKPSSIIPTSAEREFIRKQNEENQENKES